MPKLTYLGHSAFLVEGGGARLVIDPFLKGNPRATMKPEDLAVDYVLLTHGHGDHLGDALQIAAGSPRGRRPTVIAPFELAGYCEKRGAETHAMHIGGSHRFPFGRVKLTIAHHGSAAPDGTCTGSPCGFLVTIEDRTLYHSGDTGLFSDMELIGEMNPIDVALLPIGDNFTMGIADAVKAAELLQARLYVPMHYRTFEVIEADPEEFAREVQARGLFARVLPIGETLEY